MAHVDADFLALAKRFGQMLPPGPAMFWGGVLDNYEKGNIPKEIVIKSMNALEDIPNAAQSNAASAPAQYSSGASFLTASTAPGSPRPPASSAGGCDDTGSSVSAAWTNPPASLYHQPPGWNMWWGKGFPPPWPPLPPGTDQWANMYGWHGTGKKSGAKAAGKKGGSNAGKKGKAKGFRKADMTARDLSEAEARMQRFMDQHPHFVFRPREAVPEDMQAAYDVFGESGPQFWKSLRHHLPGDAQAHIAQGLVQFMAERSSWSVDQTCMREKSRKERRERDANSSRLSAATGYTGRSQATAR